MCPIDGENLKSYVKVFDGIWRGKMETLLYPKEMFEIVCDAIKEEGINPKDTEKFRGSISLF